MNVVAMQRPKPDAGTFDEFWFAYPYPARRQKALARAKWEAITGAGLRTRMLDKDSNEYVEIFLQATPAEIVDGVKRYEDKMRKPGIGEYGYKDDGKYICGAAVFLNQGRWED
jgi:hypothetical protein